MLEQPAGNARVAEGAAFVLVAQIAVRVDLHHGQRAAQRIKQAPAKAHTHGMLAAQANHQLSRARGGGYGRRNRLDRRLDVVGQLDRRQRMHTVNQRRLVVHLAIVKLELLRGGQDRPRPMGRSAAIAHRSLQRNRQHQHASPLEAAMFISQAKEVIWNHASPIPCTYLPQSINHYRTTALPH